MGLRLGGSSLNKIVKILKLPKTTVYDTIKRYENAESLRSAPRSGRPCALNVSEQKTLREIALKNNRSSAEEIQRKFVDVSGVEVSVKAIRKNLHEL